MQCTNCGAPMALIEGRNYFCCPFCMSFHFPTAIADSPDGVLLLGQRTDLQCPVCDHLLSAGSVEDRCVQFCDTCRGLLITTDDFAYVVRRRRATFRGPDDDPTPIRRDELERTVSCPSCARKMEVHPYYGPGNVVIDSCSLCKVVWIDHGEMASIQRAPGQRW